MLLYKLTEEEILEIVAIFVHQQLPSKLKGTFDLEKNKDGSIDVYFVQKDKKELN